MGLSTELISEFVKITNDNKKSKEDNTVYGTVKTVSEDGKSAMVKIDGSDELTPVTTTCSIRGEDNSDPENPYPGDRVRLTVRNHSAIVTGNVSDQSIGVKRAGDIEASISNFGDRIESFVGKDGAFTKFKQTVEGFEFMKNDGTGVKITGGQIDATGLKLTGEGAEININNVFKVSSTGVVTWSSSNSPTKAQYSANGTSGWHNTYASTDYYARYSYDGGTTWTSAILIQGKNGTNGKDGADGADGEDGADAEIPDGWAKVGSDGKTYIDGEMIYSDSIYADSIHLGGEMKVYKTKSGSTRGGFLGYSSGWNSTRGIGMWANRKSTDEEDDDGNTIYEPTDGQCICTDEAARISYGNPETDDTYAQVVTDASGNITLDASGYVYLENDGTVVARTYNDGANNMFIPGTGSKIYLGKSTHYWIAIYGDNYYGITECACTSDANRKNSIEDLPDKYVEMFDRLRPVRYKLNSGTSDRYHVGYIAQEVEEAMSAAGIDSKEFGGLVKDKNEDGSYTYMLRYGEFDAIRDAKIKQLEARNAELEARIEKLEKLLTQNT